MLLIGVHQLRKYFEALKRLIEGEVPPRRRLRAMRQTVAYLMVDYSGLGFVLVMWYKIRLVMEGGEFTPLSQGISLNPREGRNLTEC